MIPLLKSLELAGYKTFASKTDFEFAGSITAIVGPNGSGKSNIADALRWVLGEQSYSLLRGRKTADMIFSGSEQRPRAGMASATVTFDNSDGWLPIDFSEVSVARRAYRDGQNEYLINGQRVRLRDVSELLAKSGLAERTYTIIGQGLVDAALALRADERRRLFEEAAGIGLYRSRREEAMRRLETTRRNMDRVQDILAELRPRLRSLERQARRSEEYAQIKNDLRVLLREWYGHHWHRSQKELIESQAVARRYEATLETARKRQAAMDQELAGKREEILSLRARTNDLHRQLSELHAQRESISRELAVLDERQRSLSLQRDDVARSLDRIQEEVEFERSSLDDALEALQARENELQEARTQEAEARQALLSQEEKRSDVENALKSAQDQLAELDELWTQKLARRRELSLNQERLETALQAGEESLQRAKQVLEEQRAELKTLEAAYEAVVEKRAALDTDLAKTEQVLEEGDENRRSALERLSGIQSQVARLQAEAEVLNQAESALVGYSSGSRLLLQAARAGEVDGLKGALRDMIQVPAELETAVEAALGEYIDAVFLGADSDLDAALERMEKESARGALLPLDLLQGVPPLSSPKDEDSLGIAGSLVRVPEEIKPATDLLLGRVIIVRNRPAARRVLAGQPAGVRAVTLKGEIFHSEGPVLAAASGESSALSRPRRRQEIAVALGSLERDAQDTEKAVASVEVHLVQVQEERRRLAQQVRDQQAEESDARLAYQRAEAALEAEEQQVGWQVNQNQTLKAQQAQIAKEMAGLETDVSALDGERTTTRQRIGSLSADLVEVPMEELRAQATYWEMQTSLAERVYQDAKTRLEDRKHSLDRIGDRQATAHERQASHGQELDGLVEDLKARREQEQMVSSQIEALHTKIQPLEEELAFAESGQEGFRTAELDTRQELARVERYYTQAQITVARQQESLENLRRRIEDDFGLVAFEYEDEITGQTPLPFEGMVEQLPVVTELAPEIEDSLKRKRAQLRRMGAINPEAPGEYREVKERFEFLTSQLADLEEAEADVLQVIAELDALMQREFLATFESVAREFREIFTRLFGGGSARLFLTDSDDLTNTGIEIDARLPGRRTQGLSLLSGGERSLTATALVFALLKVSPTPFCVLDEVDAMLDEANIGRFRDLLQELSEETQFILITHNRGTVQVADIIYGVTMGPDSTSQVLSLKLDQVAEVIA